MDADNIDSSNQIKFKQVGIIEHMKYKILFDTESNVGIYVN